MLAVEKRYFITTFGCQLNVHESEKLAGMLEELGYIEGNDISSADQCLRNFAVRAARLSRFSASPSAPPRQTGEIVYRFIAQ